MDTEALRGVEPASALRHALGVDAASPVVVTDGPELEQVRVDRSGHRSSGPPLALVTAGDVADVQATLRFATAHRIPVIPRGAGTGLAGGATAGEGEIVLSTLAMDRILEVSVPDQLAVVQPGILNAGLNAELVPHGLWFAPDPASRAISTIGGNIATNAGGLLCAKYGVTRESVLGLKVVLADGTLLTLGHRTVKGVTGYDLTALMIGSEGTLGVIVEATLKLLPLPAPGVATIGAYFRTVRDAAAASAAVTAAQLTPAVMELIEERGLAAIGAYLGLDLTGRGSYLLVSFDGPGARVEAEQALAVLGALAVDTEMTTDPVESERLFAVRRSAHYAFDALGTGLIEDIAVPRSALPEMFDAVTAIADRHGILLPVVAHAADGNLHPTFIFEGEEVPEAVWTAAGELFEEALRLGGTLTGEHGVGLLKKRWLRRELGDVQHELQRSIKEVFDPLGILNPGKVF
ncbi:FAD-binding oxidoreductase [Naasia sp. SYSU D00948]|uniref:FAD-binding oxidoreductase n=1 Tax=Naasia sp. SYSU D00948 TaxID=2817379 RepID=UPI001B306AAB|nr:FAD-linked oxidase C-terminal domain-containing protein [Naasia sp. SYSU D00948]